MTRGERLARVAGLEGSREQAAARRLAACVREMQAEQEKLERLEAYLEEYRDRASRAAETDPVRLENQAAFLDQLGGAVAECRRRLEAAVARYREEAERWQSQHRRTLALDKLLERIAQDEAVRRSRDEQRELDERALRLPGSDD